MVSFFKINFNTGVFPTGKKCVLSSFLNMAGLAAARMSGGTEFHTGPACEKARSPNIVLSRGVTYLLLEADHRPLYVLLRYWTYG